MNKKSKDNLDSVEQIRNILFGEQVAIIEKRFIQLETSLTNAIENLTNTVAVNNKEIKNQIAKSNKQLSSDNSSLAIEQSAAISKLATTLNNKIIETEAELLNQIQAGLQKLDNKASHRNELAKLLTDMANKLAD